MGLVSSLCGQEKNVPQIELTAGRQLALQHCAGCHPFPEPDLLTKESWEFCLTYMGFFLGIVDYAYLEGSPEEVMDIIRSRETFVREAGMIPAVPLISNDQWRALRDYYISNAPEQPIPQAAKAATPGNNTLFEARPTQYRVRPALTSLVHIDEGNSHLLVHDGLSQQLTILDSDGDFLDRHEAPGVALVDAYSGDNGIYLLNIGDLFASRIGEGYGELQHARLVGNVYMNLRVLLKDLHRPADFTFADLDNDGTKEVIISNFGDYTGNLSIYRRDKFSGAFLPEPQILSPEPGIVASEAHDFNGDGLPDIVALMSAARENLSIFINQGDGTFRREIIAEQHPSFGYTGLKLRDFNNDGQMDILTLNGDNGDSDPYNTLKRDQGIRIYLNQGNLKFEEAYFYPMYGVFGAEVEDFDLDGDLDIAAIAFFPDFNQANPENFVYLEQTSPMTFVASTHAATYEGRWMTIDSGDLDGDGDKDLVLGAGYSPVGMRIHHQDRLQKMLEEGPSLLLLKNSTVE